MSASEDGIARDADTVGDGERMGDDTPGGDWQLTPGEPSLTGEQAKPRSHIRLGNYTLLRRVGEGGMGEVFEARHVETGEIFALKKLSRPSSRQLYRFKREFRLLADLPHVNVVRLYELEVSSESRAFFTMELIDGIAFVDWVRGSTPVDELPDLVRLEDALRQLVVGLEHLHANGCVHRDIKPSNVLVCADGRVVILDFGLAFEFDEPHGGVTQERAVLGTPAFMAPEQARGERIGPAADYYAVGVMLYQCLTGRLPLEGSALDLLVKKQETLDLGAAFVRIPSRLRSICINLLSRNPDERLDGTKLLGRLTASYQPGPKITNLFVGRHAELATLRERLEQVGARREPLVVHIRGRSGHGKSALVRRFEASLQDNPPVVWLGGRCRERETLPYKGVDAMVDTLCVYLRHLAPETLERLRPHSVDALARVFPVLEGIWPDHDPQALGPSEIRGASWVALREVITGISKQHALVVHIDDFQWADVDSAGLLQALLQEPRPPAMLLLLSYRTEVVDSPALRELNGCEVLGETKATIIEIGPLPATDAREFAGLLMRSHDASELAEGSPTATTVAHRTESIVLRSGGVPFFIAQMVLGDYESARDLDSSDFDLDEIVAGRLDDLSESMCSLLNVIAVSGRPLSTQAALELCPSGSAGDLEQLCAMSLLVGNDDLRTGQVETAHDRIREVVLSRLDRSAEVRLHRMIGEWLLASVVDDDRGGTIFTAVDHLNSGILDIATLDHGARVSLTDLNQRAGQRALDSGAWVTARRYFGFAMQCMEPCLSDARAGAGEYPRCSLIVFGLAQAEAMCEDQRSDVIFEDLLSWSLPARDRGQFLACYLGILMASARWQDCVDRGVGGLEHLGVQVNRRPARARVAFAMLKGLLAVRNLDFPKLLALPDIRDDRLRAAMSIMAPMSASLVVVDPESAFDLLGRHAVLTTKHGYHEWTIPALVNFSIGLAVIGQVRVAVALCDDLLRLAERRFVPVTALGNCRIIANIFVYPRCRPLRTVAKFFAESHQQFLTLGDRRLTEWATAFTAVLHLDVGMHLGEFVTFIEGLRHRPHSNDASEWMLIAELNSRCAQAMIEGIDAVELLSSNTPGMSALTSHAATLREIMTAVHFGQYERASAACSTIEANYVQVFAGFYHIAFYIMYSVIVMAERGPTVGGGERRRMRRAMRKRRKRIHQWAKDCPENFGPMADLVDAEILGLQGRFERAVAAYERAAKGAEGNGMIWLAGLAAERLARLARRCGHTLVAKASFEVACASYRAWGADAVVRKIEREQ